MLRDREFYFKASNIVGVTGNCIREKEACDAFRLIRIYNIGIHWSFLRSTAYTAVLVGELHAFGWDMLGYLEGSILLLLREWI